MAARKAKTEDAPPYVVAPSADDAIVAQAMQILAARIKAKGRAMMSPKAVHEYLGLALGHLEHEVFGVMFLDAQHKLIEFQEMFRGTLTQTSVYPREVAIAALKLNAGAVILCHNHPSGVPAPSGADKVLTEALKKTLALIDVKVLDHIIVAGTTSVSFAETGLI